MTLFCVNCVAVLDEARPSVITRESRGAYRVFGREAREKGTDHFEVLGVNGDNIKMGLSEIIWEVMEWIGMAQDREQVTGCCEDGNESTGSIICGDFPKKPRD